MENKLLILVAVVIILIACNSNKKYPLKHKFYDISIKHSSQRTDPVVYGLVKEFGTDYPVNYPMIKLNTYDGLSHKGDINGNYQFSVKPGTYKFIGIGFPYPPRKTKTIDIQSGDSVSLNFYLPHDNKPLY